MRAALVVVSAKASVSYAVPMASVVYVELISSARLDGSGLYTFVSDTATPADRALRATHKPRADAATVVDARVNAVWKPLVDAIGPTDTIIPTLVFMRRFLDLLPVTDHASFVAHKPLSHGAVAGDFSWRVVAKAVADGVGMNDSFAMGDGVLYSFSKAISNVTILSDAQSRAVAKHRADGAAVSDAGVLSMQDYCDVDYFLDDYVGLSRVF